MKKAVYISPCSVDEGPVHSKKITDVKDRWVKLRATMDTGAAGHGMPENIVSNVKLEHTGAPQKSVGASAERITDIGRRRFASQQVKALAEASNSGARA